MRKRYFSAYIIILFFLLFLNSCQKNSSSSSGSNNNSGGTQTSNDGTEDCTTAPNLTATKKIPLLVVRVQYANAIFQSNASTWSRKIFSNNEGSLNHYFNETTYGLLSSGSSVVITNHTEVNNIFTNTINYKI